MMGRTGKLLVAIVRVSSSPDKMHGEAVYEYACATLINGLGYVVVQRHSQFLELECGRFRKIAILFFECL